MITARGHLGKAGAVTIADVETGVPMLVEARNLIDWFLTMIRKKAKGDRDSWIAEVRQSLLASFATGIVKDIAVVSATITDL
jgi:transposase